MASASPRTPALPRSAFAEGQQRLLYNLSYYRSNYILIFLGLTAYILYRESARLRTGPWSATPLIAVAALASRMRRPLRITNLLLLVSLAAIAAIYVVTMRISGESVRVGPVTISRQQFNLILAIGA